MNARFSVLAALAAAALLAGGCRTAGPYERHFRPAAVPVAATAVVPPPGATNAPAAVAAVPVAQVSEATWEVPDEPVLDPASVVTAELASLADVSAWLAAGWAEVGRSEFVTTYLPDHGEAVSFAARLGAPGVLFYTEDLGTHWVWRTEWEPRRVYHWAPPPLPGPPRMHRHRGPPPPLLVSHVEEVPVERLRLERYFRNLAIFLRAAAQPPVAAPER